MKWKITKSRLSGDIKTPPSKSHTIRAIVISSLAEGLSEIKNPLLKGDGFSALAASKSIGAKVEIAGELVKIRGVDITKTEGKKKIDLGNSGTSARLFSAAAALGPGEFEFSGDGSLSSRPMRPLLEALGQLGASYKIHSPKGDFPFSVRGPLHGGEVSIKCPTSQYLSALLMACPLCKNNSVINVLQLNEKPYVDITLWWLDKQGIKYSREDGYGKFRIEGGQKYAPFKTEIPGDFSSASFPAAAALLTRGKIKCTGLDFSDPQGDKELFGLLSRMGGDVKRDGYSATVSSTTNLSGTDIDLNTMPDALPVLAVTGCLAEGETRIYNVAQARLKETDRIKIMADELRKMNASIEERPDGLIIQQSDLKGAGVDSHSDHRVAMALALAGMAADGETVIEGAEAAGVTYPDFAKQFRGLGANIEETE